MSTTELKTSIQTKLQKIENEQFLNDVLSFITSFQPDNPSVLSKEDWAEVENRWQRHLSGESKSYDARKVGEEFRNRNHK